QRLSAGVGEHLASESIFGHRRLAFRRAYSRTDELGWTRGTVFQSLGQRRECAGLGRLGGYVGRGNQGPGGGGGRTGGWPPTESGGSATRFRPEERARRPVLVAAEMGYRLVASSGGCRGDQCRVGTLVRGAQQ